MPRLNSYFSKLRNNPIINYFRIFHPFVFAIYPIIAAYTRNLNEIKPVELIRPVVLSLLFAFSLYSLCRLLIKPFDRAALLTSLLLIFLFDYGYYFALPQYITLIGLQINRHIVIIFLWIAFISIVINKWIWNHIRPHIISRYLNIISGISLLLTLCLAVNTLYVYGNTNSSFLNPGYTSIQIIQDNDTKTLNPDIYYIILDGYARQDVLEEMYGYDNSSFISYLLNKGFYIADESRSNYNQTALSLASSLNLDYLDSLGIQNSNSTDRGILELLIKNSGLVNFLQNQGYTIIEIDSGYSFTNDINSDIFITSENHISNIEILLLETSALRIPFDMFNWGGQISGFQMHRNNILNSFSALSSLDSIKSPKFVFSHILSPHPPFVFDKNGIPIKSDWPYSINDGSHFLGTSKEYIRLYVQQLIYTNKIMMMTIDNIINGSQQQPIIIIQADHGPGAFLNWDSLELSCAKERMSILNAYYLPEIDSLYSSITPVNTFRIVLNTFFNTSLNQLEDKVYFSLWMQPYKLTNVTVTSLMTCSNK